MVVAKSPLAEESGYEQGTSLLAGGRAGPDTVDVIACEGREEHIAIAGENIVRHGATRSIKASLRRAVLARDGGLHHRWLHLPLPSSGTSHRFPIPGRGSFGREPDHAVLVAPPRSRPPPRNAHRSHIPTPT